VVIQRGSVPWTSGRDSADRIAAVSQPTMYAPPDDAAHQVEASRSGWRAVLDHQFASSPQLLRYATDPREADCLRLLSGVRRGRALFLGNGLAILPSLLAEVFESVVVADWNYERLAFAERRRDEQAIHNLACVHASGANEVSERLGQFDLIALGEENPDAEWSIPLRDATGLRQIATALALDGCLMYGVRFPRVGGLVCAAARRWDGPLHYRAQARALRRAGLPRTRGYGRYPGKRPYQVYVPLDDAAVVAYWLRADSRPSGIRSRLSRVLKNVSIRCRAPYLLFNNVLVIARRG